VVCGFREILGWFLGKWLMDFQAIFCERQKLLKSIKKGDALSVFTFSLFTLEDCKNWSLLSPFHLMMRLHMRFMRAFYTLQSIL